MKIEFQVDTSDETLADDLFAPAKTIRPGTAAVAPGNAALELREWYFRKSAGLHDTLTFVLNLNKDLGVALFASWLYDKLKGAPKALRINRTQIEIENGVIRKVISEQIQREE